MAHQFSLIGWYNIVLKLVKLCRIHYGLSGVLYISLNHLYKYIDPSNYFNYPKKPISLKELISIWAGGGGGDWEGEGEEEVEENEEEEEILPSI